MRKLMRPLAAVFLVAAFLYPVSPSIAHHPGWYIDSPESNSPNMRILGSAPKTYPDSTYRNSDLAFRNQFAFAGNYLGFRIINIGFSRAPQVIADVDCPGSQHDVSVWGHLLFLSIDRPRTGPECDSEPTPVVGGLIMPGFEGIRIFDVRDKANPQYVGAVATDCGSHTHTLVPDPNDDSRVLLYVSSYPASALGPTPYGTQCSTENPGHSKISIVEVPLDAPAEARVVSQPHFELNDHHGTPGFKGCHDITVFLEIERAGAACMAEGQIWDISDVENPRTIARVHNHNFDIWHSAAFTWDGELVVFGDEAGGGTAPRCRESDPSTVGAVWIYRLADLDIMNEHEEEPPLGHYKIPRVQGELPNCTMHNFNFIPRTDRYLLVSASYSGGTTVADLTDPANTVEIGHFDPHGANTWSSYWYNDLIYTNDSGRGVDVMEFDMEGARAAKFQHMNPQTQESLID